MPGTLGLILSDLRAKAAWVYGREDRRALLKALLADGTLAMILYRLMQWSRRRRLMPLEFAFGRLNAILCRCVIGRGAEFGAEFVLIHSDGVFINGAVRGGSGIRIEHQVTIGAERDRCPTLGDNVFIGSGARVIGGVTVGSDVQIGANAVVVRDVPAGATAVGVPARVVRLRGARVPSGDEAPRTLDPSPA